jgi:hypothetical protein
VECSLPATPGLEIYSSKASNHIYLELVKWPDNGQPVPVTVNRDGFADAQLLDPSLPPIQVSATATNGMTVLSIPKPAQVDPYATVIKLTFKDEK